MPVGFGGAAGCGMPGLLVLLYFGHWGSLALHTKHTHHILKKMSINTAAEQSSGQRNITKTVTENIEVKSACASRGFFYGIFYFYSM